MSDFNAGPETLFKSKSITINGYEWRLLVVTLLLSRKQGFRVPVIQYYWRSEDTALWQPELCWPEKHTNTKLPAEIRKLFDDNIGPLREAMGQYFPEEEQISLL